MSGPSENPDLWAFLESLHRGDFLSGAVTAIERFGVFVALDDGPDHPVFPASGSSPSLNCPGDASRQHRRRAGRAARLMRVPRVRLMEPGGQTVLEGHTAGPFQVFADTIAVGQKLPGQVTKLIPFGVFVQVADGIEGLVHLRELAWTPSETPGDVVQVGDESTVVVTEIDRERRRLSLSRRQSSSAGV
ncbi:SSU ribosomal protein S1p [Streptomyces sp. PAMC 26508]|nr:SSU ribosomal protein S1p [Streptomyces sp. PAMC 26508]